MAERSQIFDASANVLGVALADTAPDFVCFATSRGDPFYLNAAGRDLIGLKENQDISAMSLCDFYVEQSWAELCQVAVPEVNQVGRWTGRSRLRRAASGEPIDVRTIILRIKPSETKPTFMAIIHVKVDELDQLKTTLAEVQARKSAILESSLDAIITIDHNGVITEFNRAAERIFGHPREKVLGTKPSDVLFPPNEIIEQQDRIDRYLTIGEGSLLGRRTEVAAMRAGGEAFPAEIAMTLGHEQGEPVLTFFVRDISRRKKAEREQARYAAELERSNRELEQFAYVASHDMQEPLRKIRTFSERLQTRCAENLDDQGKDCLQRMQSAAERMQTLIDGLLRLSRVTTGSHESVAVDLTQVAREVVSDLDAKIEQVHGRVEISPLPTIEADPLQMRQLLQNLIVNGLKFQRLDVSPVVKVSGYCDRDDKYRKPGAAAAASACHIVVKDNGIGFEEKHQERIFDLFQRLHTRDVYEGSGIGLALCRKIVERHGGQITARSTPGKGSIFEVVLPATQKPAGTA